MAEEERDLVALARGEGELPGRSKAAVLRMRLADLRERGVPYPGRVGGTVPRVEAGDRFGMIRFGSRTDLVVPRAAAVQVRVSDRVIAGVSIVALLS